MFVELIWILSLFLLNLPVPAYKPYFVAPPTATRATAEATQVIKLMNIMFRGRITYKITIF